MPIPATSVIPTQLVVMPCQAMCGQAAAAAHMSQEVEAGRVALRPNGHLARPRGGWLFCSNAFYRIGPFDYAASEAPARDPLRDKATQSRLLEAFASRGPAFAAAIADRTCRIPGAFRRQRRKSWPRNTV